MPSAPIIQIETATQAPTPPRVCTVGAVATAATALHNRIVTQMEPTMEVRVKNLSIAAEVAVPKGNHEENLPTFISTMRQSASGLLIKNPTETKCILKNVNGVFKPGTMTLVLGQPGSGKSSLLKALSGRFPTNKVVQIHGEILYNGADSKSVKKRLPQFASYVAQHDHHFPGLTVKQTLAFAHKCCGGELLVPDRTAREVAKANLHESRQVQTAENASIKHKPAFLIQQLGLESCENTMVGDDMVRGVSGGERKRVTTGEMQFGNKLVAFMDEITTGLDSAAAYDIINTQRSLAKQHGKTIVIALLQPSPEIFALFDNVMMLNDGYVIYYGPRLQVLSYFQDLGFSCPPTRDVADYLMDVGTHQQYQYTSSQAVGQLRYPRSASQFADIYERSVVHESMLKDLYALHDPQRIRDRHDYFDTIPEFRQSFVNSTMTLTRRQFKLTMHDTRFLTSRALMIVVRGFINGSVFWQFDPKNIQLVVGVLCQTVLLLAFAQLSQVPSLFATREIFYKQRGAHFFPTTSYVVAISFSQLPLAIAESLVFGSMIYWMCGFAVSLGSFALFEAMLLATTLTFSAFFFCITCVSSNLGIAQPVAVFVITLVILYSGFVVNEPQMPTYLVWIYWLDPISWCIRALAINEYSNAKYDVEVFDDINYKALSGRNMGEYSLQLVGFQTGTKWIYFAFAFVMALYIVLMLVSYLALEFRRFEAPGTNGNRGGQDKRVLGNDDSASTSPNSCSGSEYTLVQTPREDAREPIISMRVDPTESKRKVTPVALAFKDLRYTVPSSENPKEEIALLKGISGYALPGTITALMGSSGAGKTTLMDALGGRKTGGRVQGQILLNGYVASSLAIQRCTGYCEQTDIHSEASTFREALTFSAFLRQSADVPDSAKYASVDECLELLDLHAIADKIIRGSSVEQLKRLTIAVELAAQPSVLFLDEPTSGLDARAAKMVMDSVRTVAESRGCTVLCTIHQPSTQVFRVFDSLLLLQRGGETVFFGELGADSRGLIDYLQSVEGVAPLEKGANPATWMLESIGAGMDHTFHHHETDFVDIFNKSAHKAWMEKNLDREGVGRPVPGESPLSYSSKRAASNVTQAKFLIKRSMDMYWRTAFYSLTRLGVNPLLGVVFGLSFSSVDYTTYQGVNSGIGMVFTTTVFVGMIAFFSAIPVIADQRASFYRERASQTYSALWYFVSGIMAEIPYIFASTFLYSAVLFPMVGFTGAVEFSLYWLHTMLLVLMMTTAGMFLAYAFPTTEVTMTIGVLINSIFFLFMGFNPPAEAIPAGYKWLYTITPQRYTVEALAAIVLGNCPDKSDLNRVACVVVAHAPPTVVNGLTVAEYIEVVFGMTYDHLWRDTIVIMACIVGLNALALVSLRFINHQKR